MNVSRSYVHMLSCTIESSLYVSWLTKVLAALGKSRSWLRMLMEVPKDLTYSKTGSSPGKIGDKANST